VQEEIADFWRPWCFGWEKGLFYQTREHLKKSSRIKRDRFLQAQGKAIGKTIAITITILARQVGMFKHCTRKLGKLINKKPS
jgi:hypothetical protein